MIYNVLILVCLFPALPSLPFPEVSDKTKSSLSIQAVLQSAKLISQLEEDTKRLHAKSINVFLKNVVPETTFDKSDVFSDVKNFVAHRQEIVDRYEDKKNDDLGQTKTTVHSAEVNRKDHTDSPINDASSNSEVLLRNHSASPVSRNKTFSKIDQNEDTKSSHDESAEKLTVKEKVEANNVIVHEHETSTSKQTNESHFWNVLQAYFQNNDKNSKQSSEPLEASISPTNDVGNSGSPSSITPLDPTIDEAQTCDHVPQFDQPRWLKLVVKCPPTWQNKSVQAKCDGWKNYLARTYVDHMIYLPVQDHKGTVFANSDCATCHNITDIQVWTVDVVCGNLDTSAAQTFSDTMETLSNFTALSDILSKSSCKSSVLAAMPEAIQECESQSNIPAENTRSGSGSAKLPVPLQKEPDEESVTSYHTTYPVSFTILMNFDFSGNTHLMFSAGQRIVETETIPRCKDSETFDPEDLMCRQVSCSETHTLIDGQCVALEGSGDNKDMGAITDLSEIRSFEQIVLVTLQMNITYRDYILMQYSDTSLDIASQIADHLYISAERVRKVNITYQSGTSTGRDISVSTLTEDQYMKLIPIGQSRNGSTDNLDPRGWVSPRESSGSGNNRLCSSKQSNPSQESPEGDIYKKIKVKSSKRMQLTTKWRSVKPSTRFKNSGSDFLRRRRRRRSVDLSSMDNRNDIGRSFFLSLKHTTDDGSTVEVVFTDRESNTPGTLQAHYLEIPYEHFSKYRVQVENYTTSLFISEPVNKEKERLMVETDCLKSLLDAPMVMQVSFILYPPESQDSEEEGPDLVLNRIYDLIYEKRFSLKVNGNDVTVLNANDEATNSKTTAVFCPLGLEFMVYDDEFTMMEVDNITLMYVETLKIYIGVGRFDLFYLLTGSKQDNETENISMMQYAFVCFMPRISRQRDCNRINLSADEYTVMGENRSIVFHGKEHDILSYKVVNETSREIQICIPQSFTNDQLKVLPHISTIEVGCGPEFDDLLRAEGYLTIILGRVSLTAMAIVLLTYCTFSKLRNLPGINTMNLTFALFVAELIFTEGMDVATPWLCTTVAVSVHYFFLAAHCWMNVMSFDVFRTFAKRCTLTRVPDKGKYIPRYACYAWGLPAIVVAFCVFIEFSDVFSFQIGYGSAVSEIDNDNKSHNLTDDPLIVDADSNDSLKNDSVFESNSYVIYAPSGGCWIRNPLAALCAFGAPILLIFLCNCIFFGKTILGISKTGKHCKKSVGIRHSNSSLRKISGRSDVMLYVKMSTVMGFTWFFGLSSSFVSSFTKPVEDTCIISHVQGILFTILNISQGIFIFGVFVCNRRVLALYLNLLAKIRRFLIKRSPKTRIFSVSSNMSISTSSGASQKSPATTLSYKPSINE